MNPDTSGSPSADGLKKITEALSSYFPPEEVRFRPIGKPYNGECEVAAFIDARNVTETLNRVMGLNGWTDEYETLAQGEVRCRLSLKLCGEWISRSDVGSMSEQPDVGDRCKAAHSDALKRAAVKFGIGLYLYRLGKLYGKHDGKKITVWPCLPMWAVPLDCQACGKPFADKLFGLINVACQKAKFASAEVLKRLYVRYEYDSKCSLPNVELRHARLMLQEINEWISKLNVPALNGQQKSA